MNTLPKLQFLPFNFSWVALHPKPKGMIYFIGGAFFGTFPTLFYRFLLRHLYADGYTIVAIPYRFTFRHWSVATSLSKDLTTLRAALIDEANHRHYDTKIYQNPEGGAHFWLGHSLGCKYITLLELLTDLEGGDYSRQPLTSICLPPIEQEHLKNTLSKVDLEQVSLRNQSSVLIAPAIEGLEAAIPLLRNPKFSGVQRFLNRIGIKVEPTQKETFCLIKESSSFNLTSLISFRKDTRVAAPTVRWLMANLQQRLSQVRELEGAHLTPMGWVNGDIATARTVAEFLTKSVAKDAFLSARK